MSDTPGTYTGRLERVDAYRWRIPREGSMLVEGIVYADDEMMKSFRGDEALVQLSNMARLPGIVDRVLAMPDFHCGYGFPIGGVAAFDARDGVVCPGGVGYDINCGVRLLRSDLHRNQLKGKLTDILKSLYRAVPCGQGPSGLLRLEPKSLKRLLRQGAAWIVEHTDSDEDDLVHIEDKGCLPGADPSVLSQKAIGRGLGQVGSLGSGNHFLEIGFVDRIFDEDAASLMGLETHRVTVTIHTGSRGLGHQVCTDFVSILRKAAARYGLDVADRRLCCAPIDSDEAHSYFAAMACAANYAFANRQLIARKVRDIFRKVIGAGSASLEMKLVYDVCHNIAKFEEHTDSSGRRRRLCVHRKGATRAFPARHPEIPSDYRDCGQPVLVPGDMGRSSYVLLGTRAAMAQTFGSSCHGAGRLLSRKAAKKAAEGRALFDEMEQRSVLVLAASKRTLAEEMPEAYKDVSRVTNIMHYSGVATKVARLRPLGVIKG